MWAILTPGSSKGKEKERAKGNNYTLEEDALLTNLWLQFSEDPIKGVEQKKICILGKNRQQLQSRHESGKSNGDKTVNAFEKFLDCEGVSWKWNDIWLRVKEHARWKQAKASLVQKEKMLKVQKSLHYIQNEYSDEDDCDGVPEEAAKQIHQRGIGRKLAKSMKAYEKQNAAAIAKTTESFDKFVSGFDIRMNAKEEHDKAKLALFAETTNATVARARAKADKERRKIMEIAERKREKDMEIIEMDLSKLSGIKRQFYEAQQRKIAMKMEKQFQAEEEDQFQGED